jgi:hypothetical protein
VFAVVRVSSSGDSFFYFQEKSTDRRPTRNRMTSFSSFRGSREEVAGAAPARLDGARDA